MTETTSITGWTGSQIIQQAIIEPLPGWSFRKLLCAALCEVNNDLEIPGVSAHVVALCIISERAAMRRHRGLEEHDTVFVQPTV